MPESRIFRSQSCQVFSSRPGVSGRPVRKRRSRAWAARGLRLLAAALAVAALTPAAQAQPIHQIRGVDARVDYASLTAIGPWDDRNYQLTREDLDLLAPNEEELRAQIPVFFRVEMRRAIPEMDRTGPAQYPRSALQIYRLLYGGYLVDGKIYTEVEHSDGRYVVPMRNGIPEEEYREKFLTGEVRITSPNGAAESAIKVNPVDTDLVVAGSNGPGTGQKMFYSTDGGESWSPSAALPGGGTCCDPTVDWSADGTLAYTATLGNCGGAGCQIWFYRSRDGGQTWNDLPGGTPRRTLSTGSANDKEYVHVDKHSGSPFKDNIYVTWHSNNVMQVARSTDSGESWSALSFSSDPRGIGSDITTGKTGHVYYFWPAFDSRQILLRKSTDGGASYAPVSVVAGTEASFAFPVPSMETREVFVYVSADADLSSGPYGGSIYAAWTDSTSATGSNAANNHARIRVAYSRNGGSSWTVTTPHEIADSGSVDRWHQWLAVGPDGKVHVIFYDTRNGSRSTVDLYYAFSGDGAQTWSAPARVTAAQSPNIGDSFEFGDYNGLDVVMSDLIAIYTDNRNEGGGGGDSVDVYAAGIPIAGGNAAPEVTIAAPAGGSGFPPGTAIAFAGSATDAEDGNLTSSLSWSSNLDGAIGSGGSFSRVLSAGVHTVTASVTDSGSQTGSDQVTVTVSSGNTPPSVTISAPADGATFAAGAVIAFAGSATDAQDGNLTSSLSWSSNLDGAIGSGGSFSQALSAGVHTVTASVTDSGGQTGSDQITVTAGGGCSGDALAEDFEGGAGGWTTTGLWHLVTDSGCASPGYSSPARAMYYGRDASCDYDTGSATSGNLVSPQINGLSADSTLTFDYFRQVESELSGSYDRTEVAVSPAGSATWTTVWSKDSTEASENAWTSSGPVSLAAYAGQSIQLRFRFASVDEVANDFTGWLIDDVAVTAGAACEVAVEVGRVSVDHRWQTVELAGSFSDPIVVAKPASLNGSDPGVVRLRNVTPASFQVRFQEWDYLNGAHVTETVSYLVAERGHQLLPGGGEIEAGSLDTRNSRPQAFVPVPFSTPFATTPLVFSVVGTASGSDAVVTRQRNASPTGFQVVMQEQESKGPHVTETIYWIAWTPGSGTIGGATPFAAGMQSGVGNGFDAVAFPSPFAGTPCFLADMQSFQGSDTAGLRYRALTATGVEVQVDEEQSRDAEVTHVDEVVGYLAFGCN